MNSLVILSGTRTLVKCLTAVMVFTASAQAQNSNGPACESVTIRGTVLFSKESLQADSEYEHKFVCDRQLEGACPRGKEMLENDASKWRLANSDRESTAGTVSGSDWGRECVTEIKCCDRPEEDPTIYSSFYEGGERTPQDGSTLPIVQSAPPSGPGANFD